MQPTSPRARARICGEVVTCEALYDILLPLMFLVHAVILVHTYQLIK